GPPKAVEGQVDEVAPLPLHQRFALPPPQASLGRISDVPLSTQLRHPAKSKRGACLASRISLPSGF
ncbi:hypothetical protein, partial [Xylella fastidiosa]|uniref:hypothetical protein n=1 Tax=Xylella fastidiosa TaxID=2371 RepID=UPI001EEB4937